MRPECEICTILPEVAEEFILFEGKYWLAHLRQSDQTLLGTSFIEAKRHVPELHLLTPREESELVTIRNGLIRAIGLSFKPQTFNISCLKNNAFQTEPNGLPELGHVHWHIKPRYQQDRIITLGSERFRDPMPGHYLEPSKFDRYLPSSETAEQIATIIRNNLIP